MYLLGRRFTAADNRCIIEPPRRRQDRAIACNRHNPTSDLAPAGLGRVVSFDYNPATFDKWRRICCLDQPLRRRAHDGWRNGGCSLDSAGPEHLLGSGMSVLQLLAKSFQHRSPRCWRMRRSLPTFSSWTPVPVGRWEIAARSGGPTTAGVVGGFRIHRWPAGWSRSVSLTPSTVGS